MSRSEYTTRDCRTPNPYDEHYFNNYHSASGLPYDRMEPWLNFFASVADKIVHEIDPKTVLDVGCAKGFLVEALRDRGIEAFGLDISTYAISQVRKDVRPYCWVASATDPLAQRYDLIVCIEVLEHLKKEDGVLAVANLCASADDVLFSSTPEDDGDATHLNVQPVEDWAELFSGHGFYRDVDFDATFIAKHAVRFRRVTDPKYSVVKTYERKLWTQFRESDQLQAELIDATQQKKFLDSEIWQAAHRKKWLEAQLAEASQAGERLRQAIEESNATINHLRTSIKVKDGQIRNLNAVLEEIRRGLGWRLLSGYFRCRDAWLPPGSQRRTLYDSATNRLKAALKGSPESTQEAPVSSQGADCVTGPSATATGGSSEVPARIRARRFLIISGSGGDMERYRCCHVQEQLSLFGFHCDLRHLDDPELVSLVPHYGVVVLHRVPFCEVIDELSRKAKFHGIPLVMDIDDLVFDLDVLERIDALRWMDEEQRKLYADGVKRYRRTLELCNGAIVSTDNLAQVVRKMGKPAWIHRNALSLELIRASNEACRTRKHYRDRIVIGYASGTRTHNRDFKEADTALKRVLETHPQVELWIIGHLDLEGDWTRWQDRLKRIPFVPWRELPGLLAQMDISIAPLETGNPFCEAKSELKFVEAAAVGVPTVATKMGAFTFAIRHGENGLLAETPEEWVANLNELVTNRILRVEMGARARAGVLQRYHPRTRAAELLTTLGEMTRQLCAESDFSESFSADRVHAFESAVKPGVFREHLLAHALLDGLVGLEIGAAAHNPFGLWTPNVASAKTNEFYAEYQRKELGIEPPPVDIWASADNIPVPDGGEDYIISSHVAEHLPNLIGAFVEWNRIVRNNGYVFMIIPLKGALPQDEPRELTLLAHFVEDYDRKVTLDTHPTHGIPGGKGGHYHTFTPRSVLEVVYWMRAQGLCEWELVAMEEVDSKVGNGFTLVFKVTHTES